MEQKLEVIYYELVKMEKRLDEKAQEILDARDETTKALKEFKALQKQLIDALNNQ